MTSLLKCLPLASRSPPAHIFRARGFDSRHPNVWRKSVHLDNRLGCPSLLNQLGLCQVSQAHRRPQGMTKGLSSIIMFQVFLQRKIVSIQVFSKQIVCFCPTTTTTTTSPPTILTSPEDAHADTWLIVSKYWNRPFYTTVQNVTETDQGHLTDLTYLTISLLSRLLYVLCKDF